MGDTNNTNKSSLFFSDFSKFVLSVIAAGAIIFYVIKFTFGGPATIKETNGRIGTIDDKIDTVMAMNNFIMERVYNLEQKTEKTDSTLNEINVSLNQNTREVNKFKKLINARFNELISLHTNTAIKESPKTKEYYNSLDNFFQKRKIKNQ